MSGRTVCWFSAGAASAVAAKLTLAETPDATVAYTDPGNEHEDNPYLDELDPERGNHADEPDFECSLACAETIL